MNSVEKIISTKLLAAEPTIDILGADKKMLQTVQQDFANYAKFKFPTENKDLNWNLKFKQLTKEDANEVEAFLSIWMEKWLNKWKQRVKLVLENKQQERQRPNPDKTKDGPNSGFKWKSPEQKQEMLDMMISTLIKNDEICCTQLLAENLLKREINRSRHEQTSEREHVFSLLNSALRRAREIAQINSALVFVKVESSYFSTKTK